MDPVTHIASGILGGQAVRNPLQQDRYLLFFCIIAAWLPDIDNFIGFLGPEFYLVYHRGLTHSFFGGFLLAAILAGLFRIFIKSFPILYGFILAYACIVIHIFLDLITSYGTQILFPLTSTRYSIPSVFILDPLYTLVMIYLSYKSFRSLKKRKTLAMIGLLWVFIYPTVNLSIRYTLHYHVEKQLRSAGMVFDNVDISTDVLSPFYWKVIVEDATSYQIGGISLFHVTTPIDFTAYTKADRQLLQRFGEQAALFKIYKWFTDYTIMWEEQSGHDTMITFGDLRFSTTVPFLRNLRETGGFPFALTAVLNNNRELVKYHYYGPGRTKREKQLE
jgi:inner membrane protein